uniref:Uncharacterized protein n=1 Tax=Anguilla anguilla TaxID=7936 RepID=A0A0E9V327_ANGAN
MPLLYTKQQRPFNLEYFMLKQNILTRFAITADYQLQCLIACYECR